MSAHRALSDIQADIAERQTRVLARLSPQARALALGQPLHRECAAEPPRSPPKQAPAPRPAPPPPRPHPDMTAVVASAADVFETTTIAIYSTARGPALVRARHAAYLLLAEQGRSVHAIARHVGRDRSTVQNGLHRARQLKATDRRWRAMFLLAQAALQ